MTINTVYIYVTVKPNGKKRRTCSLVENPELGTLESTMQRLTADPGKLLTDGRTVTVCIDTTTPELWSEIDEPTPEAPETVVINEKNQN